MRMRRERERSYVVTERRKEEALEQFVNSAV